MPWSTENLSENVAVGDEARGVDSQLPRGSAVTSSAGHAVFLPGPGTTGLVSVIIPCYNRAHLVGETIESVLAQTYENFEAILVDDGSTDRTRDAVSRYTDSRIRYFYKENGGLSSARNFGLANARGEFIAFLDSDDVWKHWKLAAQIEIFRRHEKVGLVWSDMSTFETAGTVLAERHLRTYYSAYNEVRFEETTEPAGSVSSLVPGAPRDLAACPYFVADIFPDMYSGNLVHPPTAIVTRDRLRQAGAFQPEVTGGGAEDYHFYFRIAALGPVAFLDAPTTLYRVHPAQMSTWNRLNEARGNLKVMLHWAGRRPPGLARATLRRRLASSHAWLGAEELHAGNTGVAMQHLWRSLRLEVRQPSTIALLVVSLLPRKVADLLRTCKRAILAMVARPVIALIILFSNDQEFLFRLIGLVQPEFADI
jgi:glycosyltransferase involved in cell wall biosynthesis